MKQAPRRRWPWGLFVLGPLLVLSPPVFFVSPAATWFLEKSFAPTLVAAPWQRLTALSWKIGPGAVRLPPGDFGFQSLTLTLPPWPHQWPSGATLEIVPSDAWALPNEWQHFSGPETPLIRGFQKVTLRSGENPMTLWWGTQTFMARGLCTFEKIRFKKSAVNVSSIRAHLTHGIFRSPPDGLVCTFPNLVFESGPGYKLEAPSLSLSTPSLSLTVTALSLSGPPMNPGTLTVNQLAAPLVNVAIDAKNISSSFFRNPLPLPFSNLILQQINITEAHLSLGPGPGGRPALMAAGMISARGVSIAKGPNPFRTEELHGNLNVAGAALRLHWRETGASGELNLQVSPFDFDILTPLAQIYLDWGSVSGKCLGLSVAATLTPLAFRGRGDFHWQGLRVTDGQGQALPLFRPQNRPGQGALPLFIDTANTRGTVGLLTALPFAGMELFQSLRRF